MLRELNKREEKFLNILWDINKPMTSTDLLTILEPQGWKKITLMKAIQELSEAGYLEVVGVEKVGKTYARKLIPAISKEEFYSNELKRNGLGRDSLVEFTAALIGATGNKKEKDDAVIVELEEILNKLKGENQSCK